MLVMTHASQFHVSELMMHTQLSNDFDILVFALQVSEHASWSSLYYGRIIKEALKAVGMSLLPIERLTPFHCTSPSVDSLPNLNSGLYSYLQPTTPPDTLGTLPFLMNLLLNL